jgi:glycosyltransferase involved in cell wall biosynthesis
MKYRHKILFFTIVPSPYQRDLFGALAARDDVDLSVYYLEAESPDSPWPIKPLRSFERILPGFWLPVAGARAHVNWKLPELSEQHFVVLSSFTSLTGQLLMRWTMRRKRWIFWGERIQRNIGVKRLIQHRLAAPIGHAAAIVGIGHRAEQDYAERFPNVPHFSIPYHCDLAPFVEIRRDGGSDSPTIFLFCGQMIRRKGVDLLAHAFDRLVSEGFDARLLLVGRKAELEEFIAAACPTTRDKIYYEGFQAPDELAPYFARADAFVLPSRYDGWGVVVNQALAAGLPIITSDAVGAGLDLVEDGKNGLRHKSNDADALYEAMRTIVSNPDLRRRWGKRSREISRSLTPEAGAEKWVQVLECLRR